MPIGPTGLVGFGAKRVAAGGGASLSFIGSSTSTTASVAPHASAAAGDWAILFETGETNPTLTTPSGWTNVFSVTPNNMDKTCHYKTLASGDLSASVGAFAAASFNTSLMLVFRPSGGSISSVAVQDLSTDGASEPSAQTINASLGSAPLISFAFGAWGGASAPDVTFSTNTESLTTVAANDSTRKSLTGYKIYNSSGADGTVDITGDGTTFNEFLASFYVEFTIS